jgi:CheY-like chemotaxis protein
MSDRRRILLADDEPSLVKMLSKHLELAGYEVLVAFDGQEALTKAKAERPDLIILDIMMPKLDGYNVCATLKQDPRYQQIPILILTAKTRKEDEAMAKKVGADEYIRKPFRSEALIESIQRLMKA